MAYPCAGHFGHGMACQGHASQTQTTESTSVSRTSQLSLSLHSHTLNRSSAQAHHCQNSLPRPRLRNTLSHDLFSAAARSRSPRLTRRLPGASGSPSTFPPAKRAPPAAAAGRVTAALAQQGRPRAGGRRARGACPARTTRTPRA